LAILSVATATAQVSEQEIVGVIVPREQEDARNRLELSKSRGNYPVTPGDIYELTYRSAGQSVVNDVLVESDYTLNLNIFGKMKGENLTFPELKDRIETIITRAYPNSLPYLTISSVGVFQVYVKGEVPQTKFVTAWGLSRLSEIAKPNMSPSSSMREVGVTSKDGRLRKYDLYKALYQGALEEDPFVKPGDSITLYRRDREIEVKGEVYKPGKYQLLSYEGLRDIIQSYGGGFTAAADTSRLSVLRIGEEPPKTLHINFKDVASTLLAIEDGDVVTVPSKLERSPAVVFEGAVLPPVTTVPQAAVQEMATPQETYNRITHPFTEGETLYDAVLAVRDSLSPSADLASAYFIRQGADRTVPVDLGKLLYSYNPELDIPLQPSDRIIIPPYRYYVSVLGAVGNAGSYQYVPQKTYPYYLSLAGGVPSGIAPANISITDANGNPRPLDAVIQPEDRIIVTETIIPVAGAVYNPGSYPFLPGQTAAYYLRLAGGINPELNSDDSLSIVDPEGKRRAADEAIQPGDRIFVHSNDFLYNFNRYFPVITSGIAFITTLISIIDLLSR
jgi:polysaccharide export outer membrane protein